MTLSFEIDTYIFHQLAFQRK